MKIEMLFIFLRHYCVVKWLKELQPRENIKIHINNKTVIVLNATSRRVYATIVAVEKLRVACSESVSAALGIQHSMRMRHIVMFDLTQFSENVTERKMCVLIFCTTFVWSIFHS
jgi:dipeptide/tripeptide permease